MAACARRARRREKAAKTSARGNRMLRVCQVAVFLTALALIVVAAGW
ncbi:hypothetical protein K388_07138 [Streptomyces sp. KhCrAH-43]|nr:MULTISPECIES: hypothetical protein [unclassified Streptomyces]RAJ47827.1 hypothetical protein K388_07138 [Streptomyces sp. KhCrAH-43]